MRTLLLTAADATAAIINDPDGTTTEIVYDAADGWTPRAGKFLPATRIAARMAHYRQLLAA